MHIGPVALLFDCAPLAGASFCPAFVPRDIDRHVSLLCGRDFSICRTSRFHFRPSSRFEMKKNFPHQWIWQKSPCFTIINFLFAVKNGREIQAVNENVAGASERTFTTPLSLAQKEENLNLKNMLPGWLRFVPNHQIISMKSGSIDNLHLCQPNGCGRWSLEIICCQMVRPIGLDSKDIL